MVNNHSTSWGKVAPWYHKIVGSTGHYYHQRVIFPNLKNMYQPQNRDKVLDVGCGQGVYGRLLPSTVAYTGIDLAKELISQAKKIDPVKTHQYFVADACHALPVQDNYYDLAVSILALQNMKDAANAIKNMAKALRPGGKLILVLNHPAFRIPRQSSWEIDAKNKLEYRRINRYLSPLEVPLSAHPGSGSSTVTWSYHQPLSYYAQALTSARCHITALEEWVSDKSSKGLAKKMEDRARAEFPLFLAIMGEKCDLAKN